MTNILVSWNRALERQLRVNLTEREFQVYDDIDLIPQGVVDQATSLIYDESSVSLTKLCQHRPFETLSCKLVILTEKHPELVRCYSGATVYSFPINVAEVCRHVEKTYA